MLAPSGRSLDHRPVSTGRAGGNRSRSPGHGARRLPFPGSRTPGSPALGGPVGTARPYSRSPTRIRVAQAHSAAHMTGTRTPCYAGAERAAPLRGLGEKPGGTPGSPCVWYLFLPGKPWAAEDRPGRRGKHSEVMRFGQNGPRRRRDSAGCESGKRARRRSERAPVTYRRTVRTGPEQARSCPLPPEADILPVLSTPRATEPVEVVGVSGRANPPLSGTPGFLSAGFLLLSRRKAERKARRRCFRRPSAPPSGALLSFLLSFFYRARSLSTPLTFRT